MEDYKPILLIVDDIPLNVELLAVIFQREYHVKVAGDGKTALAIANTVPRPDLIILDIMMPDIDGYEVCKRLKANPDTAKIPVIFVTAKNAEQDEERGLRLGAVDYITKPFSIPITEARVANHIRLKQQADMLENLSFIDALTRLPNRRQFDERYAVEWKRALRLQHPIAVLMIDIDFFKQYNDHYGHGGGDKCLERIASALRQGITRPGDFVARYGGEEFVVVLPHTELSAAKKIAEKLCQRVVELEIPHMYSKIIHFVTISIGCAAILPNAEQDSHMLLELADQKLYQAKNNGRNQVAA